ncbi:double-strand break repair helicase AddA [Aestuariivirga sp.]|uniref:double-strand break repair helicase AddA n=1 Tax=Aestuariivirga sp. TaxID=2650926 RepID=UPI0039E60456
MSSTAPRRKVSPTSEQLQAADPARSVWVMANAGSGKTHVLVNRVVRLLLAGNAPQSILCLTFTKAAAAEMSIRLFRLLASWIACDDDQLTAELQQLGLDHVTPQDLARARRLFAISIETPGGLKIQTIHAFCEKLLQLFPAESGLAPGFRVMDDTDRQQLLTEARNLALAEAAEDDDLELLDGGQVTVDALEGLARKLLAATSPFAAAVDGRVMPDEIALVLRQLTGVAPHATTIEVEEVIFSRDRSRYRSAALALEGVAPYYKKNASVIFDRIHKSEDVNSLIEVLTGELFTSKGLPNERGLFSNDTRAAFADICAWFDAECEEVIRLVTLHALSRKVEATEALFRLLTRISARFRSLKQERGLYDFDDLIVQTSRLLQDNAAARWVLYKLDAGLSHILVDEAQDTSPAQWKIITALAEEFFSGEGQSRPVTRSIFVVGDIKQSIYSFQGADTDAFAAARDIFRGNVPATGKPLLEINLTVSYRSLPAVLKMVDTVFGKDAPATKGLRQDERDGGHAASRKDGGDGIFELWPLIKPADAGEPDPWQAPVDRVAADSPRVILARTIAAKIRDWIGKRLLPSQNRAVQAGDILILLQKRGALFDALLAALRAEGIPVAGADRLKLQDSLAVKDLMALAQACLLPADDLSLAAVLKSPLVPQPLDDDDLVALAAGRSGSLWSALAASGAHAETRAFLAEQMALAPVTGPHAFLARVLNTARAAIAARLGDEALDATAMLLDAALAFERDHGTSLAAFLHWFGARDEDVKRELEGPAGEVRIMTVHGAKGLEGNIVILPDAADQNPRDTLSLLGVPYTEKNLVLPFFDAPTAIKPAIVDSWKDVIADRGLDERKRLLYVAMTRARDELYIGGVLGQGKSKVPEESWYDLVERAFAQSQALRNVDDPLFDNPVRRHGDEPQWTTEESSENRSPAASLPAWATTPAPATAGATAFESVTRVAARSSMVFDREAARIGTALHRVLELSAAGDTVEVIARRLVRQKLDPGLAPALHGILTAPATSGFFAEGARSEAAIAGTLAGIGPVQGRLDRLRITGDEIWLLDFKTGRRGGPAHESHIRQMAQYAVLLAEAFPRRKVTAALLWTQDMTVENLSETALSRVLDGLRRERAAALP